MSFETHMIFSQPFHSRTLPPELRSLTEQAVAAAWGHSGVYRQRIGRRVTTYRLTPPQVCACDRSVLQSVTGGVPLLRTRLPRHTNFAGLKLS